MKPLVASGNVDDPRPEGTPHPNFGEAFRFWLKLGFNSFGGPTGQIAIVHAELDEKKKWISEARFLHALNYCMLLPGPEAQQLAIYVGWLLHKTSGGIVAGAPGQTLNPLRGCNPNPTQYSITPTLQRSNTPTLQHSNPPPIRPPTRKEFLDSCCEDQRCSCYSYARLS
jgi:hypothetical protein